MLYVVGLSIGNSSDMPIRNLEMIKNAKYLIIENDYNFQEFISKIGVVINPKEIMYVMSQKNGEAMKPDEESLLPRLFKLLSNNEDVYMVSDDGMPGIADPGQNIIKWCIENGFKVSATPGPSAVIAAVTVSGCGHNFTFNSFFKTDKTERMRQIEYMKLDPTAQVFMLRNAIGTGFAGEVEEVFPEIIKICGDRRATLCYNLTMSNETIVRGNISYLLEYYQTHKDLKDHVMMVIEGI